MGSRDRPHKEVKKKPKDKSAQPAPRAALRGPAAGGGHPEAAQAAVGRTGVRRGLRRRADGDRVPLRRVGCRPRGARTQMTITGRDIGRAAAATGRLAERGKAVDGRHPRDREAVRRGLDHEARLGGAAAGRFDPDRLDRARPRARRRRHPARPDHRDLRSRVVGQDHGLPARHRRGPAHAAASPPSSTSSTRSTRPTRAPAASTWTSSSSRSPTPASRRSRSPRPSSAPAAWTSSSSTRSRPSCRAPRSRARWATASSASRPG